MTVLQQEIGINDLINILAGFKITKSFDKCLETWEKVVPVVVGDILWKNEARAGQCLSVALEFTDFRLASSNPLSIGGRGNWVRRWGQGYISQAIPAIR